MSITDRTFFNENINSINKMISNFIFYMTLAPILFIVLTKLKLFQIDIEFALLNLASTLFLAFTVKILVSFNKFPNFTMYLSLIGMEILVAVWGSHAHIGIYITFGLIPAISCLYYNRKVSKTILAINYIITLISIYLKFLNKAAIFNINEYLSFSKLILKSYIPIAAGFSIELFFVSLIINLLTNRNYGTLKHLLSLIDDRNELIEKLRENTKIIEHKNDEYEQKQFELQDTQDKIIHFVSQTLKSHDLLTGFHVEHTKSYVEIIAKKLREHGYYIKELTKENIELFSNAAFLHDIGKIHTPEGILNKPGKFTLEEFEIMKRHPKDGADLISLLPTIGDGKFNKIAYDIALYHHEKWNGTGYPNRISGTDIPLCARIMTAADVMDALISMRTYKDPMPIEKAMRIFEEARGTQFEPCIVDAVLECKDEIEKIDAKFKKQELEDFYKEVDEKHKYNAILKEQIRSELQNEKLKEEKE